jgi:hypothetical protein
VLIKIFNEEMTVKPILDKLSVDLIKFIRHHFKKDEVAAAVDASLVGASTVSRMTEAPTAGRQTLVNSLLESIQTNYHYLLKALNAKMQTNIEELRANIEKNVSQHFIDPWHKAAIESVDLISFAFSDLQRQSARLLSNENTHI